MSAHASSPARTPSATTTTTATPLSRQRSPSQSASSATARIGKRSDSKSESRSYPSRQQSLNTTTSPTATSSKNAAASSTSSLSVNRSLSTDPVRSQQREVISGNSRTKSSTSSRTEIPSSSSPPVRSSSAKVTAFPDSSLSSSDSASRYGMVKTTTSPVSSPTLSSPLSPASLGRKPSTRLGPSNQHCYESFADFRAGGARHQQGGTSPAGAPSHTPSSHSQTPPHGGSNMSYHSNNNTTSEGVSRLTAGPSLTCSSSPRAETVLSVSPPSSGTVSRKSSFTTLAAGAGPSEVGGSSVAGVGGGSTANHHLDLKRLLSKPAPPTHSGSSIISLPSDCEMTTAATSPSRRQFITVVGNHDTLVLARQRTMTNPSPTPVSMSPPPPRTLRERASAKSMSALSESTGRSAATTNTRENDQLPPLPPKSATTLPSQSSRNSSDQDHKPTRNPGSGAKLRAPVKRKATLYPSPPPTLLPTVDSASSLDTHSKSSSSSRHPQSSSRPIAITSSRPAGSVTADPIAVRKDSGPPPVGLTPAGAVVHAYKQQEERREQLAEMSGWTEPQQHHQRGLQIPHTYHAQHSETNLSSNSFTSETMVDGDSAPVVDDALPSHSRSPKSSPKSSPPVPSSPQPKGTPPATTATPPTSAPSTPEGEEEVASGPYYTVFGSSSDRTVVAIKRQEDWHVNLDGFYAANKAPESTVATVSGSSSKPSSSGHASSSSSGGGMRSLTRKVSGRFKKVTGSGKHREDSPQRSGSKSEKVEQKKETTAVDGVVLEKGWTPYDGRPSLAAVERAAIMSFDAGRGSSVDGFVRVDMPLTLSPTTTKQSSSTEGGHKESSHGRRLQKSPKTEDRDKSGRKKEGADEPSTGGKLWKLMKRISTGGLREKYHQSGGRAESPPPVPALPPDAKALPEVPMTPKPRGEYIEIVAEAPPGPGVLLSRFMQSRSSMSGVSPTLSHKSPPGTPTATARRPSTSAGVGHRPSTATRSSSPNSSDIMSSRWFPLAASQHSDQSSSMSFGDELPPLPNSLPASSPMSVSQHIMSPSELYRLDRTTEDDLVSSSPPTQSYLRRKAARSRSVPEDSSSFPSSPVEDSPPSLPFPPRRPAQSLGSGGVGEGRDGSSGIYRSAPLPPPSPSIPSFNTKDPVNDFRSGSSPPSLALSMSEFGVRASGYIQTISDVSVATPPRPRKSSRRALPPSIDGLITCSPSTSGAVTSSAGSSSSNHTKSPSSLSSSRSPRLPSLSIDVFTRTRRSFSSSRSRAQQEAASAAIAAAAAASSSSSSSSSTSTPLPTTTSFTRSAPPTATVKFREIESAPRTALSEKEKAAKWDDLLERSARAGGTLHLAQSTTLMSDNIRFSVVSEV